MHLQSMESCHDLTYVSCLFQVTARSDEIYNNPVSTAIVHCVNHTHHRQNNTTSYRQVICMVPFIKVQPSMAGAQGAPAVTASACELSDAKVGAASPALSAALLTAGSGADAALVVAAAAFPRLTTFAGLFAGVSALAFAFAGDLSGLLLAAFSSGAVTALLVALSAGTAALEALLASGALSNAAAAMAEAALLAEGACSEYGASLTAGSGADAALVVAAAAFPRLTTFAGLFAGVSALAFAFAGDLSGLLLAAPSSGAVTALLMALSAGTAALEALLASGAFSGAAAAMAEAALLAEGVCSEASAAASDSRRLSTQLGSVVPPSADSLLHDHHRSSMCHRPQKDH